MATTPRTRKRDAKRANECLATARAMLHAAHEYALFAGDPVAATRIDCAIHAVSTNHCNPQAFKTSQEHDK